MQIDFIPVAAEAQESDEGRAAEARTLGQLAARANAARRLQISLHGLAATQAPVRQLRRVAVMN